MTQAIAKHTPGPWKWDGYSLRPENPNPDAHAVHTILEVDTFAYGFVDSDLAATTAECAANRALIEAAPDLLDALHIALPFVEDHATDPCYKAGVVERAVKTVLAAIAKAAPKVGADETAIRPAEAVDTAQPTSMPHSLYNEPEGE